MNKKNVHRWFLKPRRAISLIEVLLALVIFVLFVGGIFYLAVDVRDQSSQGRLKSEALTYAEEGLEAVRFIRDQDFWDLEDGTYGLLESGGTWSFSGTSDTIDAFYERSIVIDPVYRDVDGNIASTGTLDPLTKKVTSAVEWSWRGVVLDSVELTTYYTNWRGDQWMLTTCTEFASGTYSNSAAVAASAPPDDNCVVSLTVSEQLGTFYHSVDVGEHAEDVAISGNYAFISVEKTAEGLGVVDISDPETAYLVLHKDVNGKGNTVLVSGSTLYMGVDSSSKGLAILDVSTPTSPTISSTVNIGGYGNEMFLVGTTLYTTSESSSTSFRAYNVSNPASPSSLGTFNVGTQTKAVQVSGSYAYIGTASSSSGFKILNVSNPASITSVSSLNLGASVNSIEINGSFAYVGLNTGTNAMKVVNISNPASPSVVATLNVGAKIEGMEVIGNYLYLALDQENPGMAIVNVSNPASPSVSFYVDVGGKGTGVTVDGDLAYISLDTNNKGLVINGAAYAGVAGTGSYTTPAFDTGSEDTHYNYLDWVINEVAGSEITFQIRTASSELGLSSATWVGPDGTASSSYDTAPGVITLSPTRSGQRYVQIQATITSDGMNTSSLESITLDYQP